MGADHQRPVKLPGQVVRLVVEVVLLLEQAAGELALLQVATEFARVGQHALGYLARRHFQHDAALVVQAGALNLHDAQCLEA